MTPAPAKVLKQIREQLRNAEATALRQYMDPRVSPARARDEYHAAMAARMNFDTYCMPVSLLAEVVAGETGPSAA